jgi:hypothetical protein
MKKVLTALIVILFFSILPINVAKAQVPTQKEKAQYTSEIKQKKQIIKQKSIAIKKLKVKIDDKGEELGKVLMLIFDRELPPSGENLTAIEHQGEAIINNNKKLIKTQQSIKRLKKEANIDVTEKNYHQALNKFEKVIALQATEEEILKAYETDLQQFINLLKALQFK